jgi:cytochrome c-type biogenesis protein CcmE
MTGAGKRGFLAAVGVGIVIAIVFLVQAAGESAEYYLYTSEAVERRDEFDDGRRFRLAGIVSPGTVVEADTGLEFVVDDGAAAVNVLLLDTPPPLFDGDVPVLLAGAWEGDRFVADQVLIRHEENYEAPESGTPTDS